MGTMTNDKWQIVNSQEWNSGGEPQQQSVPNNNKPAKGQSTFIYIGQDCFWWNWVGAVFGKHSALLLWGSVNVAPTVSISFVLRPTLCLLMLLAFVVRIEVLFQLPCCCLVMPAVILPPPEVRYLLISLNC